MCMYVFYCVCVRECMSASNSIRGYYSSRGVKAQRQVGGKIKGTREFSRTAKNGGW